MSKNVQTTKKRVKRGIFGLPRTDMLFIVKKRYYETPTESDSDDSILDANYELPDQMSTKTDRVLRSSSNSPTNVPSEETTTKPRRKRIRVVSDSDSPTKINNINELPVEILVKIFSYVILSRGDVSKLKTLSLVCHHWANICASRNESLWKSVNLSEKKVNLDRFTSVIASKQISFIVDLNLSGLADLRSYHLETIVKWSTASLKRIDVSNCKKLNADVFRILAEYVPKLDALNISNLNFNMGQKNCSALFSELKSLLHLDLSNNKLSKGTLKAILELCSDLQSLDISRCFSNNRFEIEAFFGNCQNLKKLVLVNEDSTIRFDVPKKIDLSKYYLKNLEEIYFENSLNTYSFANFIKLFCKESTKLKVVSIRGHKSDETSVDSLYESIGSNELQSLSISNVTLNVADIFAICALINKNTNTINYLEFSWNRLSEDNFSYFIDFLIEKHAVLKLNKINLSGSSVDMTMFRRLVNNFKCLSEINLSSCRKLDRGLKRNIVLDELNLVTLQELVDSR